MGTFFTDVSPSSLALDLAIAPPSRPGADPSSTGGFDVALRQAARSEPRQTGASESPPQDVGRRENPSSPPKADHADAPKADQAGRHPDDDVPGEQGPPLPGEEDRRSAAEGNGPQDAVPPDQNDEIDTAAEVAASEAAAIVPQVVPANFDQTLQSPPDSQVCLPPSAEPQTTEPGALPGGQPRTPVPDANLPLQPWAAAQQPAQSAGQAAAQAAAQAVAETTEAAEPVAENVVAPVAGLPTVETEETSAGKASEGQPTAGETGAAESAAPDVAAGLPGSSPATEDALPTAAVGQSPPESEGASSKPAGKRRLAGRDQKHRDEKAHMAAADSVADPVLQKSETGVDKPLAPSDTKTPEIAAPSPAVDLPSGTLPAATGEMGQATAAVEGAAAGAGRAHPASSESAAGRTSGGENRQEINPEKFVQRVVNAFSAVGQRNGSIRLKLHPPELGSLHLEIAVKNGTLSAKLEAETEAARSALVENLPVLRERLAEQGIKIARFDVGVSDQPQGGPSERPDGGHSFRHGGRDPDPKPDRRTAETDSPDGPARARFGADGRLDVFI